MTIKNILRLILGWRIMTLIFFILGYLFLDLKPGFTLLSQKFSWPHLYQAWASFDGLHYTSIAKWGYGSPFTSALYAFFPFYPALIGFFNPFKQWLDGYIISGLIVSHLSLIFAFYFLYRLILLDFNKTVAKNTLLLMIAFPVSFFFGSVYTESLFLLISVLVFYQCRKGNFLIAAVLGLLASITRITGMFLWPVIVYEFVSSNRKSPLFQSKNLFLLLPPLGLIGYLVYQYQMTGNPLYFVTSQVGFNANREVDKIILLHQVFYRYFKMMIFVDHITPVFFTAALELLVGAVFLILVVLSFKYLRPTYSFYALFSYLLPTFTGTFSSMPRYVIVLFPLFIVLSLWYTSLNKNFQKLFLFLCVVLSSLSIILFARGYFVG